MVVGLLVLAGCREPNPMTKPSSDTSAEEPLSLTLAATLNPHNPLSALASVTASADVVSLDVYVLTGLMLLTLIGTWAMASLCGGELAALKVRPRLNLAEAIARENVDQQEHNYRKV